MKSGLGQGNTRNPLNRMGSGAVGSAATFEISLVRKEFHRLRKFETRRDYLVRPNTTTLYFSTRLFSRMHSFVFSR